MKKYKCPDCGRISTSMYCDTCQKSILSQYAIDSYEPENAEAASIESVSELQAIKRVMEENNRILNRVERHAMTMKVIMIISLICSVISVISALIMVSNINIYLG